MTHTHRAPSACPVCGDTLITTRLGCTSCGTELVGSFTPCRFCALDEADLDLLTVFLASNGNLKEVEKHLGVSYPTARARYAALLDRLGLAERADADAAASGAQPAPEGEEGAASGAMGGARADTPAPEAGGEGARDQVLAQVAAGILSPDVAADLLSRMR